jgi:hypothetical protein
MIFTAHFGKADTARGAVEQAHAKALFERLHMRGDDARCEIELSRRGRESLMFDHFDER